MITHPKPEDSIKTSLSKRVPFYTSCNGENSGNGVKRITVSLTPKLPRIWNKTQNSWSLATWIYLLSNCLLQSRQQAWRKLQVQNLKAANSACYIFSLSYYLGKAEAVNIWKHLSAARFFNSTLLKLISSPLD